jgi:hypothetical protein
MRLISVRYAGYWLSQGTSLNASKHSRRASMYRLPFA